MCTITWYFSCLHSGSQISYDVTLTVRLTIALQRRTLRRFWLSLQKTSDKMQGGSSDDPALLMWMLPIARMNTMRCPQHKSRAQRLSKRVLAVAVLMPMRVDLGQL